MHHQAGEIQCAVDQMHFSSVGKIDQFHVKALVLQMRFLLTIRMRFCLRFHDH
jgi:hypothetical protein